MNTIEISLSRDEAVVLFEFFARFSDTDEFRLRNNAEFCAFSRMAGQLQTTLTEMFDPEYAELLEAARMRLAGDYEGLAPGVEPK